LGSLPGDLPKSPGAELVVYLASRPGWRGLEEVRAVVPSLARALEEVNRTRYRELLEARGQELRLLATSDVVEFWKAAFRDLDRVLSLYGELAPGLESPLPEFSAWLARERGELLWGLWGTAVGRASRLADLGREEEAAELLDGLRERFPLEPRTALDLADLYWRLHRPREVARVLSSVLDRLDPDTARRARLHLGRALLRSGEEERGVALLAELAREEPRAELALAELEALSGRAESALSRARRVAAWSRGRGEERLYHDALLAEGEALTRLGRAREAATGPLPRALGLEERSGFSPLTLALLAEAQALWGKGGARARELAEKAYRLAARGRDRYAASRALFAWHLASGDPDKLEAARRQAEHVGHEPWRRFLDRFALEQGGDPV